ncbi:hypothetical protein C0431_04790 [bacterium]|jgi:hypothetical protein|nr:hypothetical protein [bacterium]
MKQKHYWLMAGVVVLATGSGIRLAQASDHADTQEVVSRAGTDLTDVYVFPSPENADNVVLAMNFNPLIPRGGTAQFDTDVLYQFKLDLNADGVEDRVIQVTFTGSGANQRVRVAGPMRPNQVGGTNTLLPVTSNEGAVNTTFFASPTVKVFAGLREDSFFFDLEQFFTILPDRGVPTGLTQPPANPNQPMATSWRPTGQAVDFLSNGGFNVLSIVIECPRALLVN